MRAKVKSRYDEMLDLLIEGNEKSDALIIFVHGFGTDKHEGDNLFDDISKELLEKYLIIRFDFSGYGDSEGKQEDVSFHKESNEL